MRVRAIGVLAATLAGALLAACGTTAAVSPPPASAPVTAGLSAVRGPMPHVGGTPIDIGRVRLWLPRSWTLALDECPPGAKSLFCSPQRCPPGAADTLDVASFSVSLTCHGAVRGDGSVWLFPRPLGTGPPTWRRLHVGHGSVVVEVPALGIELYGFSPTGARIAESFGPSPLESLLAARLPAAPPSGWHRVAYGTLSAEVPTSWPTRVLSGSQFADPGACGFSDFVTPVADSGISSVVLFCPMEDGNTLLHANATPGNGLWLEATGPSVNHDLVGRTPIVQVHRRVHGLRLDLDVERSLLGSDAVQVVVRHDGLVGELTVGLGRSPLVAEQILSSIELVR